MKIDTPLEDVVKHLPLDIALLLHPRPRIVQVKTLILIRQAVVEMEEHGASLDPLSYAAVLYAIGGLATVAADYSEAIERISQAVEDAKCA